uniref:Uncharacterized protein n=1 Tax=Spironucleus salmonicida TaxID=348837 RepID=V6LKT1_9EUKA|eukprot:EST44346.1 Hypothetical protein SS50377_15817 [Spironucleus salmonicida]
MGFAGWDAIRSCDGLTQYLQGAWWTTMGISADALYCAPGKYHRQQNTILTHAQHARSSTNVFILQFQGTCKRRNASVQQRLQRLQRTSQQGVAIPVAYVQISVLSRVAAYQRRSRYSHSESVLVLRFCMRPGSDGQSARQRGLIFKGQLRPHVSQSLPHEVPEHITFQIKYKIPFHLKFTFAMVTIMQRARPHDSICRCSVSTAPS